MEEEGETDVRLRALLVEDEDDDAELVGAALEDGGLNVELTRARTRDEVVSALAEPFDVVLCDYNLPGFTALDVIDLKTGLVLDVPLIVVSGGLADHAAIECIRRGAVDYVLKDRLSRLPLAVENAVHQARAARSLRESAEYLATVIDTAPDAMVRMDEAGVITDWNAAAEATFGWSRAEVLGRTVAETIMPKRFRATHLEGVARFQQTGLGRLVGTRLDTFFAVHRDGHEFPVELAVSQPTALGDSKQFVGFLRDITERKRAEQELAASERHLRESEELYRSLFEQSGVGISLQDIPEEGAKSEVRWNQRMRAMFSTNGDYGPDSWMALVEPGTEEQTLARYSELLSGATSEVRERKRLRRSDGTVVWCDLATVLVHDAAGRRSRFQTTVSDVTEQVEAMESLARRAAQREVLVDLAALGLSSQSTSEFLDRAVELLARGVDAEFCAVRQARSGDNELVRVAATGPTLSADEVAQGIPLVEWALETPGRVLAARYGGPSGDAAAPWMLERGVKASMVMTLTGSGHSLGLIGVHTIQDRAFAADDVQFLQIAGNMVTATMERIGIAEQRRLLLKRLVTAQEAERRSIAEDVHDDAVQVMTAANMRLELFRMTLADPAQVSAAEKLQETVTMATSRLRQLIFDICPPALDRYGLAAACRMHLEQFAADTGTRTKLVDELVVDPAMAIRMLLFRIFQEALVNVRKHARASLVTVSMVSSGDGAQLVIRDDGVGFSANEAFGLRAGHIGLASMRERAQMAGGWWTIEGAPGAGTTVTAWVPVDAPQPSESTDVSEAYPVA
ncbi:MAG: PAS domain S-box protein [Candidatus Dormibacteria bacterium]